MKLTCGYLPDKEDIRSLESGSDNRDLVQLFAASTHKPLDERIRNEIKSQIVVEHQASTSSCGGHTSSSIAELNGWLKTGRLTQRSRWGAYIDAQNATGIVGDRGSTGAGLVKAGQSIGYAEEECWKFTGVYHTAPPGGKAALDKYRASAARFRLAAWQTLKGGYKDIQMWLQSGQGGVMMLIPWYASFNQTSRDGFVPSPSGGLYGYHAYPLFWTTGLLENGMPVIEGPNSWGKDWGNAGWGLWRPSLIEWLSRQSGAQFIGLSDMDGADVQARSLDLRRASWMA